MRDKRAAIEIQIGVVQIMSVCCIVVVESLVVVNSLSVVVVGSSVVATPGPINVKEILINVEL